MCGSDADAAWPDAAQLGPERRGVRVVVVHVVDHAVEAPRPDEHERRRALRVPLLARRAGGEVGKGQPGGPQQGQHRRRRRGGVLGDDPEEGAARQRVPTQHLGAHAQVRELLRVRVRGGDQDEAPPSESRALGGADVGPPVGLRKRRQPARRRRRRRAARARGGARAILTLVQAQPLVQGHEGPREGRRQPRRRRAATRVKRLGGSRRAREPCLELVRQQRQISAVVRRASRRRRRSGTREDEAAVVPSQPRQRLADAPGRAVGAAHQLGAAHQVTQRGVEPRGRAQRKRGRGRRLEPREEEAAARAGVAVGV